MEQLESNYDFSFKKDEIYINILIGKTVENIELKVIVIDGNDDLKATTIVDSSIDGKEFSNLMELAYRKDFALDIYNKYNNNKRS